jgi:hypothetical protein
MRALINSTLLFTLLSVGMVMPASGQNRAGSVLIAGSDVPAIQVDLPVTFEDPNVNYDLVDFGGTASSIVNPVTSGNKVCKTLKTNAAELWAGTTIGGTTGGFANPIPFAPGSTTMTMRVYSPDAQIPVRMKVEDPLDPTKSVETEAMTTVANAWENLTFNFANQASGTAPINFSYTYKKLSVFFNFGTPGSVAGNKTYYFDDIAFNGTGPSVIHVTFNVQNPPTNPAFVFGSWTNWGNWPGNPMTTNGNGYYSTTLTFTPNTTHEFLFVSGDPPVKELLNPAWPCTNGNPVYTNRVLNLGIHDTTICFKWDSCVTCLAPILVQVNLPVTFDQSNVNYDLVDFGGTVSNIQSDPVQPSNLVCKTVKPNTSESWAGTIGGTSGGFAQPIPFAPGNTVMSMRVFSPDAGIKVRMKVEDPLDPAKSVETEATTVAANTWDTLSFNFANQAAGTPPINFSYVYKKLSVFFNFGVPGSVAGNKTYYFDDIYFGPIGPPPVYVTFRVQSPDSVPVYVFGSWSNWGNWPGTPMNQVSPGFFETLLPMPRNQAIEYLFVNGFGPTKEVLDPSWPCTNGNSQYTNRLSNLGSNDTTLCFQWESCQTCTATGTTDVQTEVPVIRMTGDGIIVVTTENVTIESVQIFDLTGRVIWVTGPIHRTNELIPVVLERERLYLIRALVAGRVVTGKIWGK